MTSGLAQDNGASAADMLKRSLQLAGAAAAPAAWCSSQPRLLPWRYCPAANVACVPTDSGRGCPPPLPAGGIAGVLVLLTLGFLASNGLL